MKRAQSKYSIGPIEFGETDRFDVWASQELFAEGNTLEELLDSAGYTFTDQDGGELGNSCRADDNDAVDYITEWFNEKIGHEAAEKFTAEARGGE